MIIKIARDFTITPGGRFREHGKFSAEEFRDDILMPAMDIHDVVTIDLDGTYGFAITFLDEVFSYLLNYYSKDLLRKKLKFISNETPTYINEIKNIMFPGEEV